MDKCEIRCDDLSFCRLILENFLAYDNVKHWQTRTYNTVGLAPYHIIMTQKDKTQDLPKSLTVVTYLYCCIFFKFSEIII